MSKSILVFACIFSMCVKAPAHVAAGDKSVNAYTQTIQEKDLKILAVGGFYYQNKVENLYLDLEYRGALTEEMAREKLISHITGLLSYINQDSVLRPYLIKERFSTDDISVSLAYFSESGDTLQVHLYKGEIIFSLYDGEHNSLIKMKSIPFTS